MSFRLPAGVFCCRQGSKNDLGGPEVFLRTVLSVCHPVRKPESWLFPSRKWRVTPADVGVKSGPRPTQRAQIGTNGNGAKDRTKDKLGHM